MYGNISYKSQNKTTFASRVIWILFENLTMSNNRLLDLRNIKILLESFLLRMKAEFIFSFADESLDFLQIHGLS
jgi:hypothetical protein